MIRLTSASIARTHFFREMLMTINVSMRGYQMHNLRLMMELLIEMLDSNDSCCVSVLLQVYWQHL